VAVAIPHVAFGTDTAESIVIPVSFGIKPNNLFLM